MRLFFLLLASWLLAVCPAIGQMTALRTEIILAIPPDPQAQEYIARAGVTDPQAKQQITRFVRGLKKLGLWDSIVCWPFPASQNAGTGTVAFSLGGLEQPNKTLTNGPTWGVNGVTTGAASYLTAPYSRSINATPLTMFAIYTGLTPVLNQVYCGFGNTGATAPLAWNGSAGGGAVNVRSFVRNDANTGFDYANSISVNGGTLSSNLVVVVPSSGLVLQSIIFSGTEGIITLNNFTTGGGLRSTFGSAGSAIYAMSGYAATAWTQSQITAFYALYKSTLGANLGLP